MDIENSKWLITGGCGFVGISLIEHLLRGYSKVRIRVLDNLSVGSRDDLAEVCNFDEKDISPLNIRESLSSKVEFVVGDIRDFSTCLKCCENVDTVVHLAANTGVVPSIKNPKIDMECNVVGAFNMLEAARQNGVNKFIFASSGALLGDIIPPQHEEIVPKPISPYGASKLAGEGYCFAYYKTFGLKTVSLRFGNVYGPRSKRKNSVVAKFFKQALNGENIEIYGDGNQTRDFIYIDDLIRAIILSIKANIGGEVFQIATCKETTVNEIAERIKTLVEKYCGKNMNIIYRKQEFGDVRRNYSDISKARKILNYESKFDIEKGLKNTLEYFKRSMT